jgi:hypothetical protein
MNLNCHAAIAVCLLLVVSWSCTGSPTSPASPTPTATPTPNPTPRYGCEFDPPVVHEPKDGATVSGWIKITVEVPEYPCIHAATTVVTVVGEAGTVVFTGCAMIEDYPTWDTTKVANGSYGIWTQRSCSCDSTTCDKRGGPVRVTVRNP